jgi:hypothetical protein
MEKGLGWAISSMVCGILGILLFLMPYFGIVLSILGVVFYFKNKESGLAKTGLITGIVGTCLNAMVGLILAIALLLASAVA